jgi:hypothetical protein
VKWVICCPSAYPAPEVIFRWLFLSCFHSPFDIYLFAFSTYSSVFNTVTGNVWILRYTRMGPTNYSIHLFHYFQWSNCTFPVISYPTQSNHTCEYVYKKFFALNNLLSFILKIKFIFAHISIQVAFCSPSLFLVLHQSGAIMIDTIPIIFLFKDNVFLLSTIIL